MPYRTLLLLLALSLSRNSFAQHSQDTAALRLERFIALKKSLMVLNANSKELLDQYSICKVVDSAFYEDAKTQILLFDKALKQQTTLDSAYIRNLYRSFQDVTERLIYVYDTKRKDIKIFTTKATEAIDKFFKSYFLADVAITEYDDLNNENRSLLFGAYIEKLASPM